MKRRMRKKLTLARETLRSLTESQLGQADGASGNEWITGCPCTVGCEPTCDCGTATCGCGGGGTDTCMYPESNCI